jgi:hypothetical protein
LILSFLQRARQRFLWNEVIAQFALGAALLMGGAVLLLIIGTGILDWRVILGLCLAGLGVAIYRTLKRIPSEYQIAVLVDQHAGLHDALSTAFHFANPKNASKVSTSIQEAQRSSAEALIPTVDLEAAIPFRVPRALYAMGVLFLVASGLFALRYGTSKKLDWRAPISQLIIESLGLKDPEAKQLAANSKKKSDNPGGDPLDSSGNPIPKSDQKKTDEPAPNNAMDSVTDSQTAGDKTEAGTKSGDSKGENGDKNGEEGDSEKAEGSTPQNGKNVSDNPSGSQEGPQQGEQSGGKQNDSNQSSLLSKMKDAMSNLLSKAKPQSGQQSGKKESGSQAQQQQKAQSQQQTGEKGSQQNQQGQSQESADSQQGEQPGDSDNQQDSQGKGSGKNSDKQASSQPGSGIGKQDGAKEIQAAQQQAAMGKLSEIIGKRSQNVSGEMMLDVQSGPQQLKTQYSKSSASHGASSGEISRDEVPVALQGYVQQYFDEVRKGERTTAPAKAKPAPPAASTPGSPTKP